MAVEDIRIDEPTWEKGNDARRREWRALLVDLKAAELWPDRIVRTMVVRLHPDELVVELRPHDGELEIHTVPRRDLEGLLVEYGSVIMRLQEEGLPMARAEALDMAKRVVHDDAARKVGALLPAMTAEHEPRRRFFSLVASLAIDTSGISVAHRHH